MRAWFKKNHNYCRCTGYKQIVDAVMAAARVMRGEATMEDIQFHGEGKRYYNSKLPRPSALAKVCGTADYGEDVSMKMPGGTLYVAPVQPRLTHHAKILSIDTSEAEKMPGRRPRHHGEGRLRHRRQQHDQPVCRAAALQGHASDCARAVRKEDQTATGDIIAIVVADYH